MITTDTINRISKSPITRREYEIPSVPDDQKGIDDFIALHPGKKVIVVQGLGFVGSVMGLVVANALTGEYAVIGIDLPSPHSYWKICSINEGVFPVIASDPKIEEYYQNALRKKNYYATFDNYAYSKADVVIVDINLDVKKNSSTSKDLESYQVDLTPFQKAIEAIGNNCKEDVLVLVETTVPPGTSQKVVKPILESCLRKRSLSTDKLKVGHSYERVMPGPKYIDSIQNFYRVFAGTDEESANAVEQFLRTVIRTDEYPLTRLGNTNATEMAKVLENSFRAMNIAFMVEWSRFAEEAGVDLYEVVNAIRMRPTHKNIMLPGLGVGGYCLTKDPLLASWARMNLFGSEEKLHQSEKGVHINDKMPFYAFEYLQSQYKEPLAGKKVLLLGVSYLNDVGDTRYTPVEGFYDQLMAEGCEVFLHDPHVRYWEEKDIWINQDMDELLKDAYDVITITTGHKEYRNNSMFLEKLNQQKQCFLYDTIGVFSNDDIRSLSEKHIVKVIGRGDL
ncbi:MAG TPA: nucleotide sugar dehydrogenase [Chitinophagaceae bacterium]|nr:nucleotide sugar dehydrogenase [Chitinophagaceae bacterium]